MIILAGFLVVWLGGAVFLGTLGWVIWGTAGSGGSPVLGSFRSAGS